MCRTRSRPCLLYLLAGPSRPPRNVKPTARFWPKMASSSITAHFGIVYPPSRSRSTRPCGLCRSFSTGLSRTISLMGLRHMAMVPTSATPSLSNSKSNISFHPASEAMIYKTSFLPPSHHQSSQLPLHLYPCSHISKSMQRLSWS